MTKVCKKCGTELTRSSVLGGTFGWIMSFFVGYKDFSFCYKCRNGAMQEIVEEDDGSK